MYKLGTSEDLWNCREKYPSIFLEPFKQNSLKPLGHAFVCEYISRNLLKNQETIRVLEVGHGAVSPFFSLFNSSERVECFGIDDDDKDNTVKTTGLEGLRKIYPNVKFYRGYLGDPGNGLPSDFFDVVFSVSVIEHIPLEQLEAFHKDVFRVLRQGGVQLHSYDRPWGGDVKAMQDAIESQGFEWIEPPPIDIEKFWARSTSELTRIVFEHPYAVMEHFMFARPREGRVLYNWVTVLVGAKKPEGTAV